MSVFTAETYLGFIALGLVVGAYGTLIGAGGGFVLMPLLLLLYPHETPEKLTSISLAIVFLNALSGSGAYARMKRIDYKSGLIFAGATIPGAILGALNTSLCSPAFVRYHIRRFTRCCSGLFEFAPQSGRGSQERFTVLIVNR